MGDDDDNVSSPRIVGGEEEISPAVVAWQAVFLKNGKFLSTFLFYFERQICEISLWDLYISLRLTCFLFMYVLASYFTLNLRVGLSSFL